VPAQGNDPAQIGVISSTPTTTEILNIHQKHLTFSANCLCNHFKQLHGDIEDKFLTF
jgi:hypothetical protein